jgi:hypothetical protein
VTNEGKVALHVDEKFYRAKERWLDIIVPGAEEIRTMK